MTVRWKPLLILSGLFFVVAVIGVVAMAWNMSPKSADNIVRQARAAATEHRYENAEIYYKQALQVEAKKASLHEEVADFYREWAKAAKPEKQEALLGERTDHLLKAAKFDLASRGPRLQLLEASLDQDLTGDAVNWANEVLKLDDANLDAHYVIASQEVDSRSPKVPDVKRHLKVLEEGNASPIRIAYIKSRLAAATGDQKMAEEEVAKAVAIKLADDANPVDFLAKVRALAVDAENIGSRESLEPRVKALLETAKQVVSSADRAPARVTRVCQLLEQTHRALVGGGARVKTSGVNADPLASAIETELEGIFQQVINSQKSDLQIYLSYADHLRFRQQRERCLQVIEEALRLPAAARPANLVSVMGLHAVAVEMALSKQDDASRYQKAEPHIQALLGCSEPRFQGLGNLFQGAIELEQSGIVKTAATTGETSDTPAATQPKLRALALGHLKQAAAQLPKLAEAQARYGVALVLNQEQGLGRQYLQNALRMGDLDPQYQFWAAWTILQAGYPEEAAPILDSLYGALAKGIVPIEMKGTLHQMSGELYQARQWPGDLEKASAEFAKAAALGQGGGGEVVTLRQAQIDVQMKRPDEALTKIDQLRKAGKGSAAAENLAILILEEQGKKQEARDLLQEARKQYPKAVDLVGLEAALLNRDKKPEEAQEVLKKYLEGEPDNVTLTVLRAQILNDELKRPDDAREILKALAERSDNSAPLVQLAQIDMEHDNLDAAAETISKIRSRWKESATGDILDGQLALKRKSIPAARDYFAEALRKDPSNKVVQFWKAQLDSRSGSVSEAAKALESLVRNRPTKEIDAGVSLMTAAQSALANLELQTGKLDEAIRRYEELKRNSENGTLSRSDRWQLITAYVAKDQWPVARRELAAILNDAKNPPTSDERVRGANLYRQQKETAPALAQLDYVLKNNPAHPAAVIVRSYLHLDARKYDEAATLIRKAIEISSKEPEKSPSVFYLMLAAVESEMPPIGTAPARAMSVLSQGLEAQPRSLELVQAEYLLLNSSGKTDDAIARIEAQTADDKDGKFRRLLVDALREHQRFSKASEILQGLVKEFPDDVNLAAALVQVVSLDAAEAAAGGDEDRRKSLDSQAFSMIADYRAKYPEAVVFLQAECDLAARAGDWTKAVAATTEIDKVNPSGTLGPLLRARLFSMQNRSVDAIQAYREALARNSLQPEIRLLLGQELLKTGEIDGALEQARIVLETKKDRLDAILLEARALAASGSTESQKNAARDAAINRLEAIIAVQPLSREAYQAIADIEQSRGRRQQQVEIMRRAVKANPKDGLAVARLVQVLASPGADGRPASASDLEAAKKLVAEISRSDQDASMTLALAVGFHKAGQLDLALPLSEKAATTLNTPVAHLNYGDLLLSVAESQSDKAQARSLFQNAVEQYDLVLKAQPNQIEAVNNKAWVMHSYLGQSTEALELAEGLLRRVNRSALPGEFYDTLGAIQESLGRKGEAEQSYQMGLARTPDHPVLNYHFGKLLASDPNSLGRAKSYLSKALAAQDQLSPAMVQDAKGLMQQLTSSISAN